MPGRRLMSRCLLILAVAGLLALAAGEAIAGGHTVKATNSNTWNPARRRQRRAEERRVFR